MPARERPQLRKSAEQRVEDSFKAKERLARRGLVFRPARPQHSDICTPKTRNYGHYVKSTSIDFEALFKGKRVLDVGCGQGIFVEEARERGILAEGIDPLYEGENQHIKKTHIDEFDPPHQYPCVVSMYSVPFYSPNAYNQRLSIYHMLRLVEPGGMLVIHPFSPLPPKGRKTRDALWAVVPSMLKKLRLMDFEIEMNPPTYGDKDFFPATLIIKKKNEDQVLALGERLGIITFYELKEKMKGRNKKTLPP
jgi:SAM-dependent methyltransferase